MGVTARRRSNSVRGLSSASVSSPQNFRHREFQVTARGLWAGRHRHNRSGGGSASVSIHVRDLAQMFNSLDPSPFWDRDLDRTAAEFIEEEFRDKQSADAWHLHVYAHEGIASADDLQAAVENYYGRLASSAQRDMHEHMWMTQLALFGGVIIFLLSMGARGILTSTLGNLPTILDEGLIILAWLALWRPAEALVYEWVPLYRKRRLFERLAGIRVSVRLDAATPAESHTSRPPAAHT